MLRAGLAAKACRIVHGRARAALAPAPYFRKDRLVIVTIICLLLCKCPADTQATHGNRVWLKTEVMSMHFYGKCTKSAGIATTTKTV
jgi:hypothetical protein